MTYIKSETASNQSALVQEILIQATKAAQQQQWLEVTNQLKRLTQSENSHQAKLFLLDDRDWQTAFNLALKMLFKAEFQHKWEITKLFPLLGEPIISPLTTLVNDETVDAEVRWFICQILGNFPARQVTLALVKLLQQTTHQELVDIAGKTLSKIGDRAVDALIDLMSQPEHRYLAVQSLSYIRTAATITPLLAVATDPDPEIRTMAIEALSSFHDPRVPPVLITALQDLSSKVRKEAAIALGFRPEICQELGLVAHLEPLLHDLNLEVSHHAAIALGRMKQETATTALSKVLQANTTPITLKCELVKALLWSETNLGISYLQQALANESTAVTQEIITVLGRVTAALKLQSTQVLIDFWLNHKPINSPQVRQALATSLGELRCGSVRQVLTQLATDSDRKVELHALAALRKLPNDIN